MGVPGDANIMSRLTLSKACVIRMLRSISPSVVRIRLLGLELETHNFVRWQCRMRYLWGTAAAPERSQARALGEHTYSRRVQMISAAQMMSLVLLSYDVRERQTVLSIKARYHPRLP